MEESRKGCVLSRKLESKGKKKELSGKKEE
jgi:hypothetical protein